MRDILITAIAFFATFYLACTVEIPASPDRVSANRRELCENPWRRTSAGWERKADWEGIERFDRPAVARIHPMLVASFQALVSIGGLMAFPHTRMHR